MNAAIDAEQIPVSAYTNFQVLFDLQRLIVENPDATVRELIDSTSDRLGLDPPMFDYYRPMNPGALFGFLYATLVVPKEMASSDYFSGSNIVVSDFFEISADFIGNQSAENSLNGLDFYRLIRNAISHANFVLIDNTAVKLWNNNSNGVKTFEIETTVNLLTNFAIAVANYCIQQRNAEPQT